jgi:hypothetical protein
VIGLAVDDGDPSALPLDADADLAFAVVNASRRRRQEHRWVALAASGAWIAGVDFGQRLLGLGRNLLSEALVRSLVVVVPAELIAERLQLVDVVGGSAGRGLAVASMAKRAGSSRVICMPSIYHRSFGAKRRHSGTERRLVRGVMSELRCSTR